MSQLDLYLLGPPRIEVDGQAVNISRRKATALFAYLALTGRSHSRDALATLLWPEKGQSSARAELRRGLYFINQALGNQWLETDTDTAGVSPEVQSSVGAGLWLDVVEFQEKLKGCDAHDHPPAEICPDCIPYLEAAVDLYTDHFMAGFSLPDSPTYDEWQFFQAEGLRNQLASALVRLSSYYTATARQDFETAIKHARRWLTLDPLHEPAQQHLMILFAQSGQRVEAIQQYHECVHILEDELGIRPSKETTQLYERIQSEDIFSTRPGIKRKFVGRPDEAAFLDSLFKDPKVQLKQVDGSDDQKPIFQTHDPVLGNDIRIQFYPNAGMDGEGLARFLGNARSLAEYNHPNIAKVLDAGQADLSKYPTMPGGPYRSQMVPFIVTESMEGVTLRDGNPWQFEEIIDISRQICAGLEHVHARENIHGSLRPEHVSITMDGAVMLTGFVVSESRDEVISQSRDLDQIAYLAPEQLLGQKFDFRTDLYAMGVMLYEMSTSGERPFQAEDSVALISQILHTPLIPPRVKNPEIPSGLENLILRLLRKDPSDRFASTIEVRQLLQNPALLLDLTERPAEHSLLDRIVRGQIVGRGAELNRTRVLWQDTLTSEGQTVLISGEPGVGKTRLMLEVVAQVVASGGAALVGACYSQGNDTYEAFQQIIRRGFRRYPDIHEDLPGYVLAELIRMAPGLANSYPDVPENPPLEPKSQQRRLVESIVTFCQALSDQAPLLIVVEDLHWSDGGTLSLFHTLARRTRRHRVMLLGTYRDIEIDEAHPFNPVLVDLTRERLATGLNLSSLDRERTGEMLTTLFAEETLPKFLDGIYLETEGNPFFVEEVCKALVESGQLKFKDGKWHRPDMNMLQIPQSVRTAILSRVEKLPNEAQETLTFAAILGREFDFNTLSGASSLDEDGLIEALENAESIQLIEETSSEYGGTFTFSHALIPATLMEGLSGIRRRILHRQAAVAVEGIHQEAYQRLAYHWGEGGDGEKELTFTIKAAEQARARYAIDDAIRLYSRALDMLPSGGEEHFDLLTARAAAYDISLDREAQQADIEALLHLAEAGEDEIRQVDALLALANLYIEIDKFKVKEPAEQALEISRQIGDITREARLSFLMCQDRRYFMDFAPAQHYLENAVALARSIGLYGELAEYLSYSTIFFDLGDDDTKISTGLEAVALSQKATDKRLEMLVRSQLAENYCRCNKPDDALKIANSVLQLSLEMGDIDCRLRIIYTLAISKRALGLLDEAKSHLLEILQDPYIFNSQDYFYTMHEIISLYLGMGEYEKSLNLSAGLLEKAHQEEASEHWFSEIIYHHHRHCRSLGKYREAIEIIAKGLPDYYKTNEPGQAAVAIAMMGFCAAMMGDFNLSQDYFVQAFMYCSGFKESLNYAFVLLMTSLAAALDGSSEAVKLGLKQYSIGLELCRKNKYRINWSIYFISASLFIALVPEDPSYAAKSLGEIDKTIGVYEDEEYQGGWFPLEYLLILASQVYRVNHQPDKADEYLRKAHDRVMLVAGNTKDDDLRRCFLENVPWNREILAEAKIHGISP